jgi:thioredoxin 1
MPSANVRTFTEANFDAEVLTAKEPVLVDFWAPWCQPCKALSPVIDALADELAGKAKVGKVDLDQAQGLGVKYGIMNLPTVLVFKGGKQVAKLGGVPKKDAMLAALGV